ncbi:hypothetical protein X797_008793 [Metarhizium robertsii]|uniref:Uncharacterized protein n=2 Tax=Metarhizium robertsii TaxID=568076 RepID=E9F6Y7_METRA|nr:uncharacterized protein MAA_08036 [Metarhizium robertsii ARSEF 23]EFY96539.1 hypothetical protein MAA_08036 [Metarhizium robertsii ARSEF 23]EXU98188.1 hypothetical protein X797_008793 [Metarhizium robertsii]
MSPRLPYTSPWRRPAILLAALLLLSWSLPAHAERDADVDESIKRIRHGPVLPPDPTGTGYKRAPRQDGTYDPLKRRSELGGNHDTRAGGNHQPHGLDAEGRGDPDARRAGRRDAPGPAPIPAYTPVVTPAPDQDAVLASQGYRQVTYYTCNTVGGNEHCGWHVPVVKAQGVRGDSATVWVVVGCLAGVFALGLM